MKGMSLTLEPKESRVRVDKIEQSDTATRVESVTIFHFRDDTAPGVPNDERLPTKDGITSNRRPINRGAAERSPSEQDYEPYPDMGHGAALNPHTEPDCGPIRNVQETGTRAATERIDERPFRQSQLNSGESPTASHPPSRPDRPPQVDLGQDFLSVAMPSSRVISLHQEEPKSNQEPQTTSLDQEEPKSNDVVIKKVIVFFGKLFIFGSCRVSHKITSILLQGSGERYFEGQPSGAIRLRPPANQAADPQRDDIRARIALFVDVRLLNNIRLDQEMEITVTDEDNRIATAILPCGTVGFPLRADPEAIVLLQDLERDDVLPLEAFALLQKLGAGKPINFSADSICRTVDGVMVDGWIENCASRNYFLTAADFSTVTLSRDMFFKQRRDVSSHLAELGVNTVTHSHGFVGHLHVLDPRNPDILAFLLEGGVAYHVARFPTKPTKSRDQMLELCWHSITASDTSRSAAIRHLVPPLLKERKTPIGYSTVVLAEGSDAIRVSVIVPFYREWQFVRSIAMMQMWFPSDYEWILVCDDPDIEKQIRQVLMSRTGLLRNRTTLIQNAANYGFSTANNIGASVSRGEFLLFMNSDIWLNDVQALQSAVDALAAGRFAAMGFRLLFEDGSVQHDGMTFARSSELDNLFLAHHPGKGLPPDGDGKNEIVEAEATTAALLLISRLTFNGLGGFSDKYVRGDFEDADLCLRLRRDGSKIGLVRSNSCFHLERQSIRRMGPPPQRMAITLLNCVTFNDVWNDDLVRWSQN